MCCASVVANSFLTLPELVFNRLVILLPIKFLFQLFNRIALLVHHFFQLRYLEMEKYGNMGFNFCKIQSICLPAKRGNSLPASRRESQTPNPHESLILAQISLISRANEERKERVAKFQTKE